MNYPSLSASNTKTFLQNNMNDKDIINSPSLYLPLVGDMLHYIQGLSNNQGYHSLSHFLLLIGTSYQLIWTQKHHVFNITHFYFLCGVRHSYITSSIFVTSLRIRTQWPMLVTFISFINIFSIANWHWPLMCSWWMLCHILSWNVTFHPFPTF